MRAPSLPAPMRLSLDRSAVAASRRLRSPPARLTGDLKRIGAGGRRRQGPGDPERTFTDASSRAPRIGRCSYRVASPARYLSAGGRC